MLFFITKIQFFCNLKLFLHFNFSDVKIFYMNSFQFYPTLVLVHRYFFYHSFKSSIAQNNKLAEVRSAISNKMEEITKDIEVKLSTAEQNREKEIQKKLDFVKKEVRHTCYGSQR